MFQVLLSMQMFQVAMFDARLRHPVGHCLWGHSGNHRMSHAHFGVWPLGRDGRSRGKWQEQFSQHPSKCHIYIIYPPQNMQKTNEKTSNNYGTPWVSLGDCHDLCNMRDFPGRIPYDWVNITTSLWPHDDGWIEITIPIYVRLVTYWNLSRYTSASLVSEIYEAYDSHDLPRTSVFRMQIQVLSQPPSGRWWWPCLLTGWDGTFHVKNPVPLTY